MVFDKFKRLIKFNNESHHIMPINIKNKQTNEEKIQDVDTAVFMPL